MCVRLTSRIELRHTTTSCLALSIAALVACSSDDPAPPEQRWAAVVESPDAALLSVHGSSDSDVWLVGADAGDGPLVLHWDGLGWEREATGSSGDLWWVQAHADGNVYMSGADGRVLRRRDGAFERLATPGPTEAVVFGVWAHAADDVYAVGSTEQGTSGFVWHYDGESFEALTLPDELSDSSAGVPGFFKVWGRARDDVWIVGARGTILRGDATRGFAVLRSGGEESLFTVHGDAEDVAIVGGESNGLLLEDHGDGLVTSTPDGAGLLQGVWLASDRSLYAVGLAGRVFRRSPAASVWSEIGSDYPVQSLHSVWVDPLGGVWTVGGDVLTTRLADGVALHRVPPTASGVSVSRYEPALD
jgi:hypothetical protein